MYNSADKTEKFTHQIHVRLTDTEFKNLMEVVEVNRTKHYIYDTRYGMANAIRDALFLIYEVEVNDRFELVMVQKDEKDQANKKNTKRNPEKLGGLHVIKTKRGEKTLNDKEYAKYLSEQEQKQETPAI